MKTIIKANELKQGDTVRIEYGTCGNFITCTVTEIEALNRYYVVYAEGSKGMMIDFCVDFNELIEKAA